MKIFWCIVVHKDWLLICLYRKQLDPRLWLWGRPSCRQVAIYIGLSYTEIGNSHQALTLVCVGVEYVLIGNGSRHGAPESFDK